MPILASPIPVVILCDGFTVVLIGFVAASGTETLPWVRNYF